MAKKKRQVKCSGKLTVRTTSSIHRALLSLSEKEGVSMNHLVANYIYAGLDRDSKTQKRRDR